MAESKSDWRSVQEGNESDDSESDYIYCSNPSSPDLAKSNNTSSIEKQTNINRSEKAVAEQTLKLSDDETDHNVEHSIILPTKTSTPKVGVINKTKHLNQVTVKMNKNDRKLENSLEDSTKAIPKDGSKNQGSSDINPQKDKARDSSSRTDQKNQETSDTGNLSTNESDTDVVESSVIISSRAHFEKGRFENKYTDEDDEPIVAAVKKKHNRLILSDSDSDSCSDFTSSATHREDHSLVVIEDSEEECSSKSIDKKFSKCKNDNDIEELEKSVHLLALENSKPDVEKTNVQNENKCSPDVMEVKLKTDIADRIRVQQLMAEEKRLEIQISKVQEELAKCKITLRTANLSALPDKGMRLQLTLARHETKIRDLLFQKQRVNDQIQVMPKDLVMLVKSNQESTNSRPNAGHAFQVPEWNKLPSAGFNVNDMGRRALESHRAQQSLTIDALTRLHNSLKTCPSEDTLATDPSGLCVTLMPHQKHALAWLLWREKEKPSGGILADDMGLGKTLTMISLILKSAQESEAAKEESESESDHDKSEEKSDWLSTASRKTQRGKTLVVCPASLIGQWENEIKNKVRPDLLRVEIYHGQNRVKKESRLCRRDVVITTYTIVARECSEKVKKSDSNSNGPIFNIRWERIILDEAHQIRNHKSQTAASVFKLRGKNRWVLTGTPINNKEMDLFALLKFIKCSPFDDLLVWKRWVENRDAAGSQRLSTIIKVLMLRRTKQDLQNKGFLTSLLSKNFKTIEVKLTKQENVLYQKLLEFSKSLLAQFIEQKAEKENYYGHVPVISTKAKRYHYETEDNPFADHPNLDKLYKRMKNMADVKSTDILVLLLRLRQICCHPYLIKSMLNKDEVVNVGIEDTDGTDLGLLEQMGNMSILENDDTEESSNTEQMSALNPENPIFSPNMNSSKINAIIETLETHVLQTKDKAIIVSQWTSMLELLEKVLIKRHVKCVSLTGSIPVKLRGGIVEKFNKKESGPKIMLLSLTAGGVGLNLVGANHLLLVDLHWNPQLEAQASDRIYRVGQEKQVHIYKFICTETIEDRIQKLQEKKLALANNALTGSHSTQASKLSLEDLKMLFSLK